jgi:hypothetical protein
VGTRRAGAIAIALTAAISITRLLAACSGAVGDPLLGDAAEDAGRVAYDAPFDADPILGVDTYRPPPQDAYPKAPPSNDPFACDVTLAADCDGGAATRPLPAGAGVGAACRPAIQAEERDGGAFACLLESAAAQCYGPLAPGVTYPFDLGGDTLTVRFDADDAGLPITATFASCFGDHDGTARCASPDTPVATPSGARAIDSLAVGDLVYSTDDRGFVVAPIARVTRVPAPRHRVVRITLDDGASFAMSAPHPTADGRTIGDLRPGDRLGERRVRDVETIDLAFPYTVDILPASRSGAYVAAGALVGSTLAR